jgi:hypothetical protein
VEECSIHLQTPLVSHNQAAEVAGGSSTYCKQCRKLYNARYRWTAKGVARKVWSDIERRVLNRDGRHKSYAGIGNEITPEQWLLWAIPTLTQFWLAHPGERPSLDRINPYANYSLTNIRWLTPHEHATIGKKKQKARILSQNETHPPLVPWQPSRARVKTPVVDTVPASHPLLGRVII